MSPLLAFIAVWIVVVVLPVAVVLGSDPACREEARAWWRRRPRFGEVKS